MRFENLDPIFGDFDFFDQGGIKSFSLSILFSEKKRKTLYKKIFNLILIQNSTNLFKFPYG